VKISLRTATPADASRAAEILLASRRAFLPYAPFAHSEEEVKHWIGNLLIPKGRIMLGLIDDEIAGVLVVSTHEHITWIDQLYVHPNFVGQGLGAALLASVTSSDANSIRLYTFQQNVRARSFYERHGFVAIQFSDGSENELNTCGAECERLVRNRVKTAYSAPQV
jgi:ribosomal protein S18 acetylase RimI-like enzyme